MLKDKFLLGLFAGVAGGIVKVTLNFFLNLIPAVSIKLTYGASSLFVSKNLMGTFWGAVMGLTGHLMVSGIMGLGILYVIDKTDYKYLWLKGVLLGLGSWFVCCGLLSRFLGVEMPDKFIDAVLLMLLHIPYGLVTVWFIERFRYKETTAV